MVIFTLKNTTRYITSVTLDSGERVKVSFEPVVLFGRTDPSIFSTNNYEVAEKLKKHPSFNTFFFVKEEIDDTVSNAEKSTVSEKEMLMALLSSPDSAIYVDSVTSVRTANNWLQQNHRKVFENTRPIDIKKEAAREYNVIFPNW